MKLWQYPGIGTWYIYFDRNNKKSLKTKDKKEAQILFRKYQKDLLEGKLLVLNKSEKLNEFIKAALNHYKTMNTAAYHTSMKYTLNYLLDFLGDKEIGKITRRDIDNYVQHRLNAGYAKTSVNIDIRNIKTAMSLATSWEIINKNPLTGYKQIRIDKTAPKFLQQHEIQKMLSIIDDTMIKRAFLFYVLTGCRRDEIINLTWSDVDLNRGFIYIRKTKTHLERHIPINDSLKKVLDDIPHKVGRLFPMHKDTMSHKMKKYLKNAGLGNLKLHSLRHTFASLLAMSGESLKTIGELLGHTDTRTTEIYAHLTKDYLTEVVNKIKIDIQ